MPQRTIDTPVGPVRIGSTNGQLDSIRICPAPQPDIAGDEALLDQAAAQLTDYFAGRRTDFDLPLAPARSPRGAELREAIRDIGYGSTLSYGMLARIAQSGPRAIGQACARNPLPIIIPCHRVVGSDGLGHYSGGEGLATKRWLLAHEAREIKYG